MQLVMFSKHLAPLSIAESCARVRDLHLDGLDLTVRPGGHVLPENVAKDLPAALKTARDHGLAIPMITTAITDAGTGSAEQIAATAASLGIKELKLGYWPYKEFGRIHELIDSARQSMDGLEALGQKHGVRFSIHSHSGSALSAEAGNIYLILKDRNPRNVGAYLDPGHMTLEGGGLGWMQGIDLLQKFVTMVAVKSWGPTSRRDELTGELHWDHRIVPLREGTVRWREVFRCLKQLSWDGVVTFHSEYQGKSSWRDLSTEELVAQTREDVAYLRPLMRTEGLLP